MTNSIADCKEYWHGNTITPQHWNLRGYTQGRGVPPDNKAIVPNNDEMNDEIFEVRVCYSDSEAHLHYTVTCNI